MCKWIRIGDWFDEEIVSAGIKEPRNSQQEKKCMQKCMVSAVTLNLKKEF